MPMDIDMCLPLDDKTNPLYNQPVSAQINCIINWKQHFPSARALFALPKYYTQQDVVAAYRQLSKRIHPDKNLEIPVAGDAFAIINSAKDFLDFVLLSTTEQENKIKQVANNPFFKAAQENPLSDIMFSAGLGHHFTHGHGVYAKEDFNNPSLYKERGFSAILAVLERGRKAVELEEGLHDFCPFKLPPAAKERLATLMAQGSTVETINIVDWLNLCRYQDDFDLFQQLCDYALTQKHQAPLEQIKNFLPKSHGPSDKTTLVNHLFAVIDARTAHFVMSQLSRFIDTNAQDELLNYFKSFEFNTAKKNKDINYHVIAAFLGWHPSSEQLRTEIRERIKRTSGFNWKVRRIDNSIPDEELYFDKYSIFYFYSRLLCSLPDLKERQHISALISVLREQEVLTVSEALYIASRSDCLDEVSAILSKYPKLPINPYYLLYRLIGIDVFNHESWAGELRIKNAVLPGSMENTRENFLACITRLFKQILGHAELSPEQLTELFLFLLENKQSPGTNISHFILARMDECALTDTLQNKIWRHCIKIFTHRENSTFLDTLIKRASPLFFDSIPLRHYLFETDNKSELITKVLSAEPRFLSCHYAKMPVMTKFENHDFLAPDAYDKKYRIGTVNGLYLHHSLTTTNVYGIPKQTKPCAMWLL